jgi:hypothetical protein
MSCLRASLSNSCNGYEMRATPCCVVVLLDIVSWCIVVCWLVSWILCCSSASVGRAFEPVVGNCPAVAVTPTVTWPLEF